MKAIIVEDNPNSAQVIQTILAENEPAIEICGIAETVQEAAALIRQYQPGLWLLDIRLKDELVFSLFQQVDESIANRAAIIFITAYNNSDYLHKAIKSSALDYIYKPIDDKELLNAVQRSKSRIEKQDLAGRIKSLERLVSQLNSPHVTDKLSIFRVNGMIDYTDTSRVMYIEADQSISRFYLADGTVIPSIRNLGFYKKGVTLQGGFIQISKKYIVNVQHVQSYDSVNNELLLDNGLKLPASRRRGKALREYFRGLY